MLGGIIAVLAALTPGVSPGDLTRFMGPADAVVMGAVAGDLLATAKDLRAPRLSGNDLVGAGLGNEVVAYTRPDGSVGYYRRTWWRWVDPERVEPAVLVAKTCAWVVGLVAGLLVPLRPPLVLTVAVVVAAVAVLRCRWVTAAATALTGVALLALARYGAVEWPVPAITYGVWAIPNAVGLWRRGRSSALPEEPNGGTNPPAVLLVAGLVGYASLATRLSLHVATRLSRHGVLVALVANTLAEAYALGAYTQGVGLTRATLAGLLADRGAIPAEVWPPVLLGLVVGWVCYPLTRLVPSEGPRDLTMWGVLIHTVVVLLGAPWWYVACCVAAGAWLHWLHRGSDPVTKGFVFVLTS